MSNLQPRLSGILAQFPDIHCPSVRHSHAQDQEEGHHPCPTILMPEAHRAPWSSLSNKASCHSCLRSCDFSSFASLFIFPHTHTTSSPMLLRRPDLTVATSLGGSEALRINRSPPPRHSISYPPVSSHLAFALQNRTLLTCFPLMSLLSTYPSINSIRSLSPKLSFFQPTPTSKKKCVRFGLQSRTL